MRVHEIKSWPRPFADLAEGQKRADFRRDDRDYTEHDLVILREWIPEPAPGTRVRPSPTNGQSHGGQYSGAALVALVTHVESTTWWGGDVGYVVLSLLPIAHYGVDDQGWRMVVEGDDRPVLPFALRRSLLDEELRNEFAELRAVALEESS